MSNGSIGTALIGTAAITITAGFACIAAADEASGADTFLTVFLIAAVLPGGTIRRTIRPCSAGAVRAGRRRGGDGLCAKQAGPQGNERDGGSISHFLLRVHWLHPLMCPNLLSKSSILASGVA